MPVMDGCEATSKIRTLIQFYGFKQPLIIGTSGQTEQKYVEEAIKSGMNSLLSKPINLQLVKRILKKMNYI